MESKSNAFFPVFVFCKTKKEKKKERQSHKDSHMTYIKIALISSPQDAKEVEPLLIDER